MTCHSTCWLAALFLSAFAFGGCTHEEDLGARDGSTNAPGAATKVTDLCEKFPDHRLNWKYWKYRSDSSPAEDWTPAPGQCATLARCLDGPTLDPIVVARTVDCLSRDVDKLKEPACTEKSVKNASATRSAVTATQTACAAKVAECKPSGGSPCDDTAVLDDPSLDKVRACFDKPCSAAFDCLDALLEDANECIDDLF